MSKIFLRVFYVGKGFHAFQRQPNVKTVEGTLLSTLIERGILVRDLKMAMYTSACRTDRGVHALSQTIAFVPLNSWSFEGLIDTLTDINETLTQENIVIWGVSLVDDQYHPRYSALYRTYLYVDYRRHRLRFDEETSRNIVNLVEGVHDFSMFTTEKKANTLRRVLRIRLGEVSKYFVLAIEAYGFLRQMVRRLAYVVEDIAYGRAKLDVLRKMLEGKPVRKYLHKISPAENTLLLSVSYPFNFTVLDKGINIVMNILKNRCEPPLSFLLDVIEGRVKNDITYSVIEDLCRLQFLNCAKYINEL